MMKKAIAIALAFLAGTVCHAAPDFTNVGVGDQNDLVIPGLLSIPAPGPATDWDWLVGDVVERSGITIRPFYCQKAETETAYQVVVYTLPESALSDKKAFLDGLLGGAIGSAKNQGFSVTKTELSESDIPAPGFTRMEYHLEKGPDRLFYLGFAYVQQQHAVTIQYSDSTLDSRDPFVAFAKGLRLEQKQPAE